ncbi:hypothetical protein EBP26_05550 [Stutzerimonas stutzeri ATCC 17588 = LMG 11199]|nr:hypothetical protein EBP26_05550 [Stutzerimonas stutzeri ATCC 17588 = LMG 11199]
MNWQRRTQPERWKSFQTQFKVNQHVYRMQSLLKSLSVQRALWVKPPVSSYNLSKSFTRQ